MVQVSMTAAIGGEQAFCYKCADHPECGDGWHIVTLRALEAMAPNDPEWYFIVSHIPEIWGTEWDWENPA